MAAKANAFEKTLQNTFKLAEYWNTNLVLQKADAFLSTTTGGDIVHNSMVSGGYLAATVSHLLDTNIV